MSSAGEKFGHQIFWARQGFATLCDQVLISGSNFLLTLTLAKLMGPEQYGAYAIMFSVFLLLGNMHQAVLLEPMSVFQPAQFPEDRRQYIGGVLWMHVGASAILMSVFGITALVLDAMGQTVLASTTTGLMFAAPCILLLWSARAASYLDFRPGRAAKASAIYCAGMMIALVIVYKAHLLSPRTTFMLMGWASLLGSVFLIRQVQPQLRLTGRPRLRELIREHWDYGRWSLLGVLVSWLEAYSYYLVAGTFLGMREAGALAALASFSLPVNHALSGSSRLLLPVLSKHASLQGKEATRRLAVKIALGTAGCTTVYWLIATLLSRPLLGLAYGEKYLPFADYVPAALFCSIFVAAIIPLELALRALQAPRSLLKGAAISGTFAVVMGLLAVWQLGLPGIFLTTAMAGIFHLCIVNVILRRETMADRRAGSQRRLPVLAYHHIGPPRPGILRTLTMSPARFSRQMWLLSKLGFQTVTQEDVLAWQRNERDLPPRPVMITFDDGYEDLCEHAFPALQRNGFTGVVFIVTGHMGGTNVFDQATGCSPLRLMTAEQIRDWAGRGIEFGAHSRNHFDLTTAGSRELSDEVEGSRQDLEAVIGKPVLSFAYPYGAYNSAVEEQTKKSFELVFTTLSGVNDQSTSSYQLRRSVNHHFDTPLDTACRAGLGWSPVEMIREYLVRPVRPFMAPLRTPYLRGTAQDA